MNRSKLTIDILKEDDNNDTYIFKSKIIEKHNVQKNLRELEAIKNFSYLYQHKLTYIRKEPPNPDFEITMNKEKIGVEISQYINGSKFAEYKLKNKICLQLHDKLKKYNTLRIKIFWKQTDNIINLKEIASVNEISDKIAKVIFQRIPKIGEKVIITPWKLDEINISTLISRIDVNNNPNVIKKCFVEMSEAHYSTFDNNIIHKIVLKKEKLLEEKYKKFYRSNWLIIPAFGEWFHSDINSDCIEKYKFESTFDKVFSLDFQQNRLIKLKD